ncbi:MAG TPA: hypothetical protein PKC76_15065 [Saprospiraceae bacterium]|nr:hypothetical protein [Saprospiraceae bacterium]HMP25454.1 hypothetical protein [Saprospiraceae bacterium]
MAKRTVKNSTTESHVDNDVMLRASALAGVLLGIILGLLHLFLPTVLGGSRFGRAVQIGLELFAIWLIITSAIRSIHHFRGDIPTWKLLLAGCLTAVVGPIVREILLRIVRQFTESISLEKYNFKEWWFFAGLGLLAASIATIRLRIKNRALGNMMELGLIALVAFLFFYYTK